MQAALEQSESARQLQLSTSPGASPMSGMALPDFWGPGFVSGAGPAQDAGAALSWQFLAVCHHPSLLHMLSSNSEVLRVVTVLGDVVVCIRCSHVSASCLQQMRRLCGSPSAAACMRPSWMRRRRRSRQTTTSGT